MGERPLAPERGILPGAMNKNNEVNTGDIEPRLTGIRSLCVYCGSWSGIDPELEALARTFGSACAARGIELIYGGGGIGLMGTVAEAALAAGGRVIGIMPRSLLESEAPFPNVTELVIVDSMHERKKQMFDRADGFVVLPGGLGTLDETIEMITWRQLGFHEKPIVLANSRGYWNPLLTLFDHIVATGFAQPDAHDLYAVAHSVDGIFERLTNGTPTGTAGQSPGGGLPDRHRGPGGCRRAGLRVVAPRSSRAAQTRNGSERRPPAGSRPPPAD